MKKIVVLGMVMMFVLCGCGSKAPSATAMEEAGIHAEEKGKDIMENVNAGEADKAADMEAAMQ